MNFFTTNLFKYLLVALIGAGLLAVSYWKGAQSVRAEWKIANLKTEAEIRDLKDKSNQVTVKTEIKYVDRVKYITLNGETIVQQVPVYVTTEDNSHCTINAGFVRLYNSAIENNLPRPPSETDRDASGISLAEVVTNAATNYSICRLYKERAIAWEQWAKEQKRVNP